VARKTRVWQGGHAVRCSLTRDSENRTGREGGEGCIFSAFKRPAPAVWGNGLWGSVGWSRAIL
jgi:hypothetical protein